MVFKAVRLIVFDLDYTLADTSDGIVHCFNETRKRFGEPTVDPAEIKARIGLPINETFALFGSSDPLGRRELFRRLAREGNMAARSSLFPGVKDTLAALSSRGYVLGVASTKSHAEIVAVLDHLGAALFFMEFVGSDEAHSAKPAPDPLLLMMKRTGYGPAETVYVGDHLVDIQSARAAGVRVIAVTGYGGPCPIETIRAAKPDAIIGRLPELLDLML